MYLINKLFRVIFFIALILYSKNLFALDLDKLFKDEITQDEINLEILNSSYAKFNFISGVADGKYKLKDYKIIPIKKNIYKLLLNFQKKKGVLHYTKIIKLYFWSRGRKIVFATPKGKIKGFLKPAILKIVKKNKNFEIIKEPTITKFTIPVNYGKIFLNIYTLKLY